MYFLSTQHKQRIQYRDPNTTANNQRAPSENFKLYTRQQNILLLLYILCDKSEI